MKSSNRITQGRKLSALAGATPQDRPESTPNPADAGCNSKLAQYSNTPSLRVAEFVDEDDDEDENEAQLLNITSASSPNCAKLQDSHNVFSEYLRENADSMDQFREPGVRLYD